MINRQEPHLFCQSKTIHPSIHPSWAYLKSGHSGSKLAGYSQCPFPQQQTSKRKHPEGILIRCPYRLSCLLWKSSNCTPTSIQMSKLLTLSPSLKPSTLHRKLISVSFIHNLILSVANQSWLGNWKLCLLAMIPTSRITVHAIPICMKPSHISWTTFQTIWPFHLGHLLVVLTAALLQGEQLCIGSYTTLYMRPIFRNYPNIR